LNTKQIIETVEWAGFEKTALWHTRVGYTIEDIIQPFTEKTLEEYKVALEIDPDFGPAHFKLATAAGDLEMYDMAIFHMTEVRRVKWNVTG